MIRYWSFSCEYTLTKLFWIGLIEFVASITFKLEHICVALQWVASTASRVCVAVWKGRVSAIHSCENLRGLLEVSVSSSNSNCCSKGPFRSRYLSVSGLSLYLSLKTHCGTVSIKIYYIMNCQSVLNSLKFTSSCI